MILRSDLLAALLGTAIVCSAPAVAASPTTFTYQGQLAHDGNPAEGAYEFEIRLLDNLGNQIGMTQTASEIVTAGKFTMEVDFGNAAFDGNERYLEISVRSVADGGAYITLSPNQVVTSTPVAQFALEGNEGPQGPAGAQGDQGIQGDPGTPGDDGDQGPQGDPGTPGAGGSDGAPGSQGPQGDQGDPGDSHWTLSGSNTYFNAGKVGVGTDSPDYPLHVVSSNTTRAITATTLYSQGVGIFGAAIDSSGGNFGIVGRSMSTSGTGMFGAADGSSGTNYGVRGQTNSPDGYAGYFEGGRNYFEGKVGIGTDAPDFPLHVVSSGTHAVFGQTSYGQGIGVYGYVSDASGPTIATLGRTASTNGIGVYGWADSSSGTNYGVRGETNSPSGYAGHFIGGKNYFEGKVGIGTNSPSDKLHISVPADEDAFRVQSDGITRIRVNANGGVSLGGNSTIIGAGDVYIAGNLGIGTNAPTFDLSVSGTAAKTGGGSWAVFSDQRLKKNITSMTGSLDTISALHPVNFEYKSEDHFSYLPGIQRGFIAQEVQKVIPQWVNTADDGFFYLDQVGYEALIVDAIQELRDEKDAENLQLRNDVTRLQSENNLLKARLDRLERMMALSIDQ